MKDERYLTAFEPELEELEREPEPLTDHEKLMQAFARLHNKCDEALERIRKRRE